MRAYPLSSLVVLTALRLVPTVVVIDVSGTAGTIPSGTASDIIPFCPLFSLSVALSLS